MLRAICTETAMTVALRQFLTGGLVTQIMGMRFACVVLYAIDTIHKLLSIHNYLYNAI
jgi:hypothetical protein